MHNCAIVCTLSLSISYLQMVGCHNFTHFCAVSLEMLKSSRGQGVLSCGHCSRCSIVCVSVPQLHEGSPVWYSHLIKFALVRPTPDLSRLSVFHDGQDALLSEEDSQMVEFPYRQRVGWILTYQSIVPCFSLLWSGEGVEHGSDKIFLISTSSVLAQIQIVGALGL